MKRLLSLLLLAACGNDGGVRTLPDAAVEEPGIARVSLRRGRVPVADHTVLFQGPDGAELASVKTGADGIAAAAVPPDSSITVVGLNRANQTPEIQTVMGVQPGDTISLVGGDMFPQAPTQVVFPDYPTAHTYSLTTTCGGDQLASSPGTQMLDQCSPRIDSVLYALDDGFGVDAYIAKLDQPIAGPLDFSGETWRTPMQVTTTLANMPTVSGQINSSRFLVTERGFVSSCYGYEEGSGRCPSIPGTTSVEVLSYSDRDEQGTEYTAYSAAFVLGSEADQTIDMSDALVRAPSNLATFDSATRTLSWPETATGTQPEHVTVSAGNDGFRWFILAPYSGPALVLPPLVGEAAPFADAAFDSYIQVELGTSAGGYDAVRPHGTSSVYDAPLIDRLIRARVYDG